MGKTVSIGLYSDERDRNMFCYELNHRAMPRLILCSVDRAAEARWSGSVNHNTTTKINWWTLTSRKTDLNFRPMLQHCFIKALFVFSEISAPRSCTVLFHFISRLNHCVPRTKHHASHDGWKRCFSADSWQVELNMKCLGWNLLIDLNKFAQQNW